MSKTPGMMDDFRPIMPSLIRLFAGVVVLLVIQNVVLGLPGIGQVVPNSTITMASLATFTLGLVASLVVFKFGTRLADAAAEAYRSIRAFAPLMTWFFQIAAIYVLYIASREISSGFFASAPWAYPLIFLALAIVPTARVVVGIVRVFEAQSQRHRLTREAV